MRRWSIAAVAALALAAPVARSEDRPAAGAEKKAPAEAAPAKPKEKKAKPGAKKAAASPAEKKVDEKPCQPVAPCAID